MDDAEVTVPSSEVTTEDNQASPDDDHMVSYVYMVDW